jgi:hypothetical protein
MVFDSTFADRYRGMTQYTLGLGERPPNQALPEGGEAMPLADPFGTSSACPEECITRSVILNINEHGCVNHG